MTVSNTYQSAALTVSKEVAEGGSQARAFSVRIQLKGSDYTPVTLDRSYPVTYGLTSTFRRVAAPTSVRFNDGVGTLTLYHGENAVISGLPKGVIIAITEPGTADDGYTAAYRKAGVSEATCEFALNSDTSVAVVNTYSAGSLTVTKNVTGTAGDQNTAFNFTVKLSDETVTGPRGSGVTFEKGSASFSLKHGEKKTILGLPAGVTYTVTETEANQDGYTTTYKVNDGTETDEPATGTIAKDAVAAVTVTNHKDTPAGPGPGNGGGTVDPPIDEEPDPSPSPSPSPSASPEPSASPAPTLEPGTTSEPFGTPAPTRQPGTTSQPYGTPTPGGNGSGGPTSPATGDGTVIEPWAALLGLSLMGLAAVIVRRKRRQRG